MVLCMMTYFCGAKKLGLHEELPPGQEKFLIATVSLCALIFSVINEFKLSMTARLHGNKLKGVYFFEIWPDWTSRAFGLVGAVVV